jgi:hypothetical protein
MKQVSRTALGRKARTITAVLFIGSAISSMCLVSIYPDGIKRVGMAGAFGFVASALIMFFKPRLSCIVGFFSGIAALYWFLGVELSDFPCLNSWILGNVPDDWDINLPSVKIRIFFVIIILSATTCALIRLLPTSWEWRRIAMRERTWPAFMLCFVVVLFWYGVSVSPYRIPIIVDAVGPELSILHVEKNGMQFHETSISVNNMQSFFGAQNDRRLFQYQFPERVTYGGVPKAMLTHVQVLTHSPQIKNLHTPPAIALRSWKAEGWYMLTRQGIFAFTTEYGTKPPQELVDLFRDLQSLAPQQTRAVIVRNVRDVCLGFCYDPLAGLGIRYINNRCRGSAAGLGRPVGKSVTFSRSIGEKHRRTG